MPFTTVSQADYYGTGAPTHNASIGSRYTQTDATAGFNLWLCTGAPNVWTKVGGSIDSSYVHGTFKSPSGSNGVFHSFGYYQAPAAAAALNQGALTQTLGTANNPYCGKVFIVASGAGTVGGTGSTGVPRLTITGTSVTTAGVRTGSDSEVIVADATTATTNKYYQSAKRWLGQVTLTLSMTGDRSQYAFTFNYGIGAWVDFGDRNVVLNEFDITGRGGATDTGFNLTLLHHTVAGTGWTYSAAAFAPGGTVLCDMATNYSPERAIASGIRFRYYREALGIAIAGASGDGIVLRITTTQNNAVESMDARCFFSIV